MRERNTRIAVYLSAEEAGKLNHICKTSGQSRSAAVRQWILGCEIKPRPPDSYKDLARELSAIGNNINQIAHTANAAGKLSQAQAQQAAELMRRVWRLVEERV